MAHRFLFIVFLAACTQTPPGEQPIVGEVPDAGALDDREKPNDSGMDPGPLGDCVSDRAEPPSDARCTCTWVDCEATMLECRCDLDCYGDPSCLVSTDPMGNGMGEIGCGDVTCSPETDLTVELVCMGSECQPDPNTSVLSPVAPPSQPSPSNLMLERQAIDVGVLFVVDNSGSMADDQMAAACAIDSFFGAAGARGASYQTGVLTTDMTGNRTNGCTNPGTTYDEDTKQFVSPPRLSGLDGPCSEVVDCACGTNDTPTGGICNFNSDGAWLPSDAPGAEQTLKHLIVQGDVCSNQEGGLEQAFQFFAELERLGTFAGPYEIVVISDENALADDFLCPFSSIGRNTAGIPNFNPPPPAADCAQAYIDFYSYYFTSRDITVHGILFTDDCQSDSSEETGDVYIEVVQATGGQTTSICHCEDFSTFFQTVGDETSIRSTAMCFPAGVDPDPSTIVLTYVEGGASSIVPESATDGWTYDASTRCIVLEGSWAERFGAFSVEFIDRNAVLPMMDPIACLDPALDILEETIAVYCDGAEVPKSATEGWTFDPNCFTFHGSWATATCMFTVEYF